MEVELKADTEKIEIGDALVFDNGTVRIIMEMAGHYGAYAPEEDYVYYSDSKTIEDLISKYNERSIVRIIKKRHLKIIEV